MCVTVELVSSVHTQINSESCSCVCDSGASFLCAHTGQYYEEKSSHQYKNYYTTCPKIASSALEILCSNSMINLCTVHLILQTIKIKKTIMHLSKILIKHIYIVQYNRFLS